MTDLSGDSCGLGEFLVECIRECNSRYCRLTPPQVTLRKKIVVDICERVSLFWEGTLDVDDRWIAEGILELDRQHVHVPGATRRSAISSHAKQAMNHELYNVRGSGVQSAYHLSIGMAAGRKSGKEEKRAAVSQDPDDKDQRAHKRAKIPTKFAESTCRDMGKHHMWQYYCTMRPCFKHV